MAMRCPFCGTENPEGKRFCGMCGERLEVNPGEGVRRSSPSVMQYANMPPAQSWPYATAGKTETLLCRIFGGVGWLVVSLGTFLIAFGWLGTLDISYYDDPYDSLRMIGYGVIMLAISAILFSVREFAKTPQ